MNGPRFSVRRAGRAARALLILSGVAFAASARAAFFQDVTTEFNVGVNSTAFLGPGCAMADLDADGDLDLYVVDGMGDPNRLFRNDGPSNFVEAASSFNLVDDGYGKSTTFVDWDNDGDLDFLLTRFGPTQGDRLFRNNGDGTFADVTAGSGFDLIKNYHTGAAWADYDKDGLVDCYVMCYAGDLKNSLMKNLGDGHFVDVAGALGLWNNTGFGFQPGWIDYDLDNDMDLYLANDVFGTTNRLYRNNGDGTFTDVSEASHTDKDLSTMGLAIGDPDNDGDPDMYMTNIYEGNVMLRNMGNGTFLDVTLSSGTGVYKTCWGSDFLDYNNDGRLDLYVCAMIPGTNMGDGPVRNKLYRNNGGFVFSDVSTGSGADDNGYSYGSCQGDYDNDGDLDIYVTNWYAQDGAAPSALYENLHTPRGQQGNDFVRVKLVGTVSNRDAIGAKVELSYVYGKQYRWRQCGSSYVSCSEPTLHFGMRDATVADYVRVTWPSGLVEQVNNVPAGSTLTLVEGQATSDVPSEPRLGELRVVGLQPNPVSTQLHVNFAGVARNDATLRFLDPTGREIKSAPVPANGAFVWDGRDSRGALVPSGVYFLRLDQAGRTGAVRRVTVIR